MESNNWEQDLQETFSSLKDDIKTYLSIAREESYKKGYEDGKHANENLS